MPNSSLIVNSLSRGFLLAMLFGTAAYAQEAAATGSAQPSRDSSTVADSPSLAEPAQQAEDATASASPSLPSRAAATLASPQTATTSSSSGAATNPDDETSDKKWHIYGTVYLWVPSMHGTVGIRGYDTDVHVTTGDIFSNFRGGFLGVFTPSYNRFSAPVDVLWMRLRASKPVPSEVYPGYSVRATLNETIITPKVNYLAVNDPKLKIYGTAGARER